MSQKCYLCVKVKDFVLIIPCYNNREGLLRSLHSIGYERNKFEVLIVDDGSAEPLLAQELCEGDLSGMQLQVYRNETNKGVAVSLNRALSVLLKRDDVKYIARLDAGDLCAEERFTMQVSYMDEHPEVALVGSRVLFEHFETGKSYLYKNKTSYPDIQKEMHFKCSFIHPSVMFRKELLHDIGLYPENYPHCEDYAFFFKIIKKHEAVIFPEILLVSEISREGVSAQNRTRQIFSRMQVVNKFGSNTLFKIGGLFKLLLLLLVPVRAVHKMNTINK
jgi:glycosyltransferase involved in cell wall biosynthesis